MPTLSNWAAGTISVTCNSGQVLNIGALTLNGAAQTLTTAATCVISSQAVSLAVPNTLTCVTLNVFDFRVFGTAVHTLAGAIVTGSTTGVVHVSSGVIVTATITANALVVMGPGATVAATAVVGNGAVGPVHLNGCTVNNGATVVATTLGTFVRPPLSQTCLSHVCLLPLCL
jgi:hypothetical protein